ncbi:outer membrane protein assembly factor BamB family protein [Allostreptomyces psammosilenae]|uniref:Outer membrane protein assembly factor BamB n=1 Tax=Allostreptomyces psammosilenae TaxID=1892865 RepID=A0A852ZWY5_9ACTN|nr:PQQ-binding-like beta-propeller repeat protein [Allostreptomyces psammosilenae]NYI03161.1 outer membrane protein assembly factor BamB [Allostreptomyces psammosilenae]
MSDHDPQHDQGPRHTGPGAAAGDGGATDAGATAGGRPVADPTGGGPYIAMPLYGDYAQDAPPPPPPAPAPERPAESTMQLDLRGTTLSGPAATPAGRPLPVPGPATPPGADRSQPSGPAGPADAADRPGSRPGRPRRALTVATTAAATLAVTVVAALVLGSLGYLRLGPEGAGGDDPGASPSPSADQAAAWPVVWKTGPVEGDLVDVDYLGTWLLDDQVVRGDSNGLRAYDLATGEPAWQLTPPDGGRLCAMSPTVEDGIGAVAFRDADEDAPCATLLGVATGDGAEAWRATEDSEGDPLDIAAVGVAAEMVATWDGAAVQSFRRASGEPRGVTDGAGSTPGCLITGMAAGGDRLVMHQSCTGEDVQGFPESVVVMERPGSGEDLTWSDDLGGDVTGIEVLGFDPLVIVRRGASDDNADRVVLYGTPDGQAGRIAGEVALPKYTPEGVAADYRLRNTPVRQEDTLYLGFGPFASGAGIVIALDVPSGRTLWQIDTPGDRAMTPVAAVDGGLLVAADPESGHVAKLHLLDAATGAATPVGDLAVENPEAVGPDSPFWSDTGDRRLLLHDGLLVTVTAESVMQPPAVFARKDPR